MSTTQSATLLLLHQRLTRRGLELPAALGTVLLSREASAAVPATLRTAAIHLLDGSVSARVAVLADGILTTAVLTPMKATAAVILMLGVLAAGAAWTASHFLAVNPAEIPNPANAPPKKPKSDKAERSDLYGDPLPPGALARMGTLRFRHSNYLGSVVYSPDGKVLAAAGQVSTLVLYDAATGRKLREWTANARSIPALAFAPDGKTLASVGFHCIQIWQTDTGKELRRFDAKVDDVRDAGFGPVPLLYSRDGTMLASAADHSVRVWDAKSGKELVQLQGHRAPVRCLAFSADGKTLFSASGNVARDGSVRVWRLADGKELRKRPLLHLGAPTRPDPLCFSADGKTLAFAAHESLRRPPPKGRHAIQTNAVHLLDVDSGEVRRKLQPVEGYFKSAAFSADGKTLATMNGVLTLVGGDLSADNNRITVWQTATGRKLSDFPAYSEPRGRASSSSLLAFAADGKKLAAVCSGSSLHVWDVERGREYLPNPEAHNDFLECVTFAPDGRTLATASSDHTIALWDAATGRQRRRLLGHQGEVSSLAFAPDGKLLASAGFGSDSTVRLWDVAAGKELRCYEVPFMEEGGGTSRGVLTWVAFTANGTILAAGGTDRKLRLWDVATGKELFNGKVRGLPDAPKQGQPDWPQYVRDVAFAVDGRVMALSTDKTVYIVDVAAAQQLFSFERKQGYPTALALAPDGKTLLCGGQDKAFRLVEVASGKDLHRLKVRDNLLAASFSPDGRTVAVSDGEINGGRGLLRLFDVPSGKELLRLRGHQGHAESLAFSPDGTKLASGQWDTTALVWDVSAARRKLPVAELSARDLERLWIDFKEADASKAHAALWALVAVPDKAVPFLKEHLHPVPRVAADRLSRLIADLDADDFAQREKASRQLAELGSEVEPALRKALQEKPSLETRRRVEALLPDLSCQTAMTPDALRQLRAIQVLEQIGSAEARQILTAVAQGAPAAPATRDAAAALERLARRSIAAP